MEIRTTNEFAFFSFVIAILAVTMTLIVLVQLNLNIWSDLHLGFEGIPIF